MRLLRFILPVLLAGLMWTSFAVDHAYAADDPPPTASVSASADSEDTITDHELACADGVCTLRVDLGPDAPVWLPATGLALTVLEDNLRILPDGAGFAVSDELTLDMPVGNLNLADANIHLVMGDEGRVESFYGTATIPTPSLGILGPAAGGKPISASIGFDHASALPAIDAALDAERKYLFFDLAAGTELAAALEDGADGALWLSIPEGQRATVVIDPQDRFAYIDGNVSVRYSGNLAFLTQLIDPMETVDLWNGELPLRHQATVHVSGSVSDELKDTRLELEGRYAVDGGKVAEWLKLDGDPLAIEGGIVISDEGMLGTGVVRSTLLSERVMDGAVQAQVFVPFSTQYSEAYVALNTRLDMPFANVSADGYARLDGALDMIADGSFEAPWRPGASDAIVLRQSGADNAAFADTSAERGRWVRAWEATSNTARTGFEYAQEPARSGYGWVLDKAGSGYESASTGLEWSIDLASQQWCSTTGLCQVEESAQDAGPLDGDSAATAMR